MGQSFIRPCAKCQYYRMRAKSELFHPSDLGNHGVLKAKLEWDQQQRQHAEQERLRFESNQWFDYEPYHYPWCIAYTYIDEETLYDIEKILADGQQERLGQLVAQKLSEGAMYARRAQSGDPAAIQYAFERGLGTVNPVTGEFLQIYQLCARCNPNGQCQLFNPK